MDTQLLWFLGLAVIALTQALVLVLRLSQGRINKKNNNPGNYGIKIAKLETKVENIEGDIREIKEKLEKIARPGK